MIRKRGDAQLARRIRRYLRRHGPSCGATIAAALGVRSQAVYQAAHHDGIAHCLMPWPVACGRWVRERRVYFLGEVPGAVQVTLA
jgi:hypothetical protein